MRKISLKAAGAITLGLSLSMALPTYADAYNVSQADFDAAIDSGDTSKNIICDDAGSCNAEGDYTLTGDVNITSSRGSDVGLIPYTLNLNGNSTLDLNGKTFSGSISNSSEGANVTIKDGKITNGGEYTEIIPDGAEDFTLENVTVEDVPIRAKSSTVNINGGTYTSSTFSSVLFGMDNSTVNITDGTFKTTADGAPVIMVNNQDVTSESTLNISGGKFISEGYTAIDFNNEPVVNGIINTNISGGTFTGKRSALVINDINSNNISLTGGTYKYTDKEYPNNAAIIIWDGQPFDIMNLVADGYHFTNDETSTREIDRIPVAMLGDTSVVPDESEEESKTNKSGIKSPDTGAFTHETEGASATISTMSVIVVAAALGLIGYKKFANRK